MFFEPYALDIAARLTPGAGTGMLDIAAGTGIVTRQLLAAASGRITAGDRRWRGDADAGAGERPSDPRLEWMIADACALPFGDGEFDAVVRQMRLPMRARVFTASA